MNIIIILVCVMASVGSVPCRKRNEDMTTKPREGFNYYFHTTTTLSEGSTITTDNPITIKTITPRGKICAPYEFNNTICEYVGDRELCGYNKNPERVESKIKSRFLSNGCWLRKGRVECGYKEPFDIVRRPPVNYPQKVFHEEAQSTILLPLKGKKITTRFVKTTQPTTTEKECVEIHSRIVCRPRYS